MTYLGDYAEDYATLNFKFTTRAATGIPTDPVGLTVAVYKGSSSDEVTAPTGITLVATGSFDTVVGLNNLLIDLSANAFYATGQDYAVVVRVGTVEGVSIVGETVCTFSIENRWQEADLTKILGHILTQTGTQVADAFQFFFDVASPVFTCASVNQGGDNNVILASATYGNSALKMLLDTTGIKVATNADKTGYSLAATGLDLITATAPAGVADTFPKMLVQLWWRFFKKATKTDTLIKTYAADGATVVTTQVVSDDGTTETQGAAS